MARARCSALPVLQYCGQAQIHSAQCGAGRSAALGTAYHGLTSGDREPYLRLSAEEQEKLDTLAPLTAFRTRSGYVIEPEQWEHELPGSLCSDGSVEPEKGHGVIDGTCDLRHQSPEGTLYMVDIKLNGLFTEPDGVKSLQLLAYCVIHCRLVGADRFVPVIYDATEATWHEGEPVEHFSDDFEAIVERVIAAAANYGGEYSLGSHCSRCYGRSKCPQYLMPDMGESALAPFTKEGGITKENAFDALMAVKRAEDTISEVKRLLKAYVEDNDGIPDGKGKVWRQTWVKGRAQLNRKALERDHPDIVQQYFEVGAPFCRFEWKKEK